MAKKKVVAEPVKAIQINLPLSVHTALSQEAKKQERSLRD